MITTCTKEELKKALKHLSIIHCTNKPWELTAWGIDEHYQLMPFFHLEPQRHEKWWQVALQTPFFNIEFKELRAELRIAKLELHILLLTQRLSQKDALK